MLASYLSLTGAVPRCRRLAEPRHNWTTSLEYNNPMSSLILQIVLGACIAGFVQGLSGFGFGMVAMAVWAWSVDPVLVGPMVVFGSLVGQLVSLNTIKRNIRIDTLAPFIVGGVLGVPLGVFILKYIDLITFRTAVGIVLISYCSFMLISARLPIITKGGRIADGSIGFVSGIMGGIGGLVGPVLILWCTLRGWGKDMQRAVFQPFFLVMHVLTLAVYTANGLITAEVIKMFAFLVPAMLIPAWHGARVYKRLNDDGFRRLILGFLLLSGIALLSSTVPTLIR